MIGSRNEVLADFTREITKLNTSFKQYLQLKMRQHEIDLTFEMLQVLYHLWQYDGTNQQEIANATVKDKASMTYLIDNLVKRNLVSRQEDASDRRNKLIFLTKEGKALQATMQPWVQEMYSTTGADINVNIIKDMLQVLQKMQENLRKESE